jgi:hypothetical protein
LIGRISMPASWSALSLSITTVLAPLLSIVWDWALDDATPAAVPHPAAADAYRQQVQDPEAALNDPAERGENAEPL